eukprot:gene24014-18627_t
MGAVGRLRYGFDSAALSAAAAGSGALSLHAGAQR